jgi:hypothetical protein
MSPEQSNNIELFNRLVEYHLGLLSTSELEQTTSRLEQDRELKQLSSHVEKALAPLESYEIDIPVGLDRKIKMAIRAQKINTDALLRDLTVNAPAKGRSIFTRWADFVGTAAAILLICSAVTLSTDHTRRQARKALCAGNLGILGSAISTYANDYYNQLPQASIASNSAWYDSERQTPKRGNLFVLVKRNYIKPQFFACPEDSSKQVVNIKDFSQYNDFPSSSVVSYSFQNLHSDRNFRARQLQLRWQHAPAMPIMADRTPLLKQNRLNSELTSENAFSTNHARLTGQNVLVLDGQVVWQTTPVFGPQRDNIWQAGQIRSYRGVETPVDPVDCFLAP